MFSPFSEDRVLLGQVVGVHQDGELLKTQGYVGIGLYYNAYADPPIRGDHYSVTLWHDEAEAGQAGGTSSRCPTSRWVGLTAVRAHVALGLKVPHPFI